MIDPNKRLTIAIFAILTIFIVGILGYHFIEGWSFWDSVYMMVITLTTIGYGEVKPLSTDGKIFTIFLIIFGVGTVAYLAQGLAKLIIEGEFKKMLTKQKIQRKIDELERHFIICGYGKVGKLIASELKESSINFVIIDDDEEVCELMEEKGLLVVKGNATDDEILKKGGIERARGLVSAFPSDADNVYVVLSSRELNKDLIIISRCKEEESEKKLYRAGANKVISPYYMGALRMAMAITKPNVYGFLELITENKELDLNMEEILICKGSVLHNVPLKNSQIRDKLGIIIIGIKKPAGNMIFNPGSEEIIQEGDHLIALGDKEQTTALRAMVKEKTMEGILSITKKLNLKDACRFMNNNQKKM